MGSERPWALRLPRRWWTAIWMTGPVDALTQEPPDPQSPLLGLKDKVLLSPHMVAANPGGGLLPAIPWVEAVILAALNGEIPKNIVNEDALPL